jgi:hypothetical protein
MSDNTVVMHYSYRDQSKSAQKWRLRQADANSVIGGSSGLTPEMLALMDQWIDDDVSQNEAVRRLTEMIKP